ncbi:type II secretion system minor pseudopilin GspJ [uncultured Halopseudomonas sp.]|uniref:type II secretion system minor pseudopilin GspJ n=1 Tax=uncultured Halopseudomonas sp. TaxID=2901193 RepID=UPI0030ED6FA4|tara:strand:- start:5318 stop:5950 length:633 start_codon:yes stop_codon:yes gene_type:complete
MTKSLGNAQRGFTLLEMLIAMAVFAIMSVVAYGGLRAVLSADQVTQVHARRLADLQVTLSVLERDLAQVVAVAVRDEFGDRMPPLRLRAGGDAKLLELVRAGAGGDQRLRRTAWLITDRGLERQLWPGVDIVDAESARVQPFGELVAEDELLGMESGFALVVRTEAGLERVDSWPAANADAASVELPMAIEIVLDLPEYGVIRRMMAVGM